MKEKPKRISNARISHAFKLLDAERKVIEALAKVKPDQRLRVLRAAAILQGVELVLNEFPGSGS